MPLLPLKPARRRQPILEHDAWLRRLVEKYGLPRAVLARMLCPPGALEVEIGLLIADAARAQAHGLFADGLPPPTGGDVFDRAVRGVYARLQEAHDAAEEAERQRRYAESDVQIARMRAAQRAGAP